jgi:hypothetical protein
MQAARIAVSNLHKQTKKVFSEVMVRDVTFRLTTSLAFLPLAFSQLQLHTTGVWVGSGHNRLRLRHELQQ